MCGLLLLPSLSGAHGELRHTSLKRSEPAKGSRLATPPSRISLWFTAKPELAFSKISLAGPLGVIPLDTNVADTAYSLHARIPQTLPAGEYRVLWQTGGTDGHAGHGPVPPPARDETGYRTARWFEFVALLTVLGALGFRHGVLPPLAARGVPTADASGRARRLGQSVLVLYLTAALVRLYTQTVALNGPGGAFEPATLTNVVTRTTWGIGWSAGVIGAVLLLIGWLISRRSVTIGTPLALTGALGMVLSPALSGHAAASRHFILSTTLDMLHVTAAGVWLGGLLMVLFAGIPAMLALTEGNRHAAVSALVNSFHPLALFCAPITVLAGLGTSWIRLGRASALWPTLYGRTLLVKLALVSLVLALGAYNSMRARRRLGGADASGEATRRFRLSATGELALGALVLVVTTFLVVTPVPGEMSSP